MRVPRVILVFAIATCLHGWVADPARAEWGTQPVTVTPTTASIPEVEACPDGTHGTFVSWVEAPGILRVQHLLPTGDLDPAWPAEGAIACATVATRTELFTLPDRLGGLYLYWRQGSSLRALRVDGGGTVVSGWPAEGRVLGTAWSSSARFIEDGTNGFYAAWVGNGGAVRVTHVWPGDALAGGRLDTFLAYSPPGHYAFWPQIALAPDGGVFLAFMSTHPSTWTQEQMTGSWRLRRLTIRGLNADGWPAEGISFGEFASDHWFAFESGGLSFIGLSGDGRGGVFLVLAEPVESNVGFATATLYRLQGNGAAASVWPVEGTVVASEFWIQSPGDRGGSFVVSPDGLDGAWVGMPQHNLHTTPSLEFIRVPRQGPWSSNYNYGAADNFVGCEAAPHGDGGFFIADFHPSTPFGINSPAAYLRITKAPVHLGWGGVLERHSEYGGHVWYRDIGLASTEDGDAVLFWSQVRERIGLFARKFNAYGEVTGVTPITPTANALRGLRYVRGAGVQATVSSVGASRLELFDLAGRRVSSIAIGTGSHDLTLPGTDAIASGLYFARLVASSELFMGKVLVAR